MARTNGTVPAEETWRMEQFSRAYVKAVASVAACSVEWSTVDNDSVDGTLRRRSPDATFRAPLLDLQLKATYSECIHDEYVSYPLSLKNYDELRCENLIVPRILVVVVLPTDIAEWTQHQEAELGLRKCGYWTSLRGHPAADTKESKTVRLSRQQVLDAAQVDAIFGRLEAGDLP